MNDLPKVSICIPSYNHAQYLSAAIESALGQTYPNVEVVLVDDGSKDGSLEIAERYAAKYPDRFHLYAHPNHENRGISTTANLAFEKSTGEYWSGLPSDDVLHRDKVEKQVNFFSERPDVDFVYGPIRYINQKGDTLSGSHHGHWGGEDITSYPNPLHRILVRNVIPGMTAMIRRSFMDRISLRHEPEILHSDWNFWALCFAHGKGGYIKKPLVSYRLHDYNTSVGISNEVDLRRSIEATEGLVSVSENNAASLATPESQAILRLQLCYLRFCLGETKQANQELAAAFSVYPNLRNDFVLLQWWVRRREPIWREPIFPLPDFSLLAQLARTAASDMPALLQSYPVETNFLLWFLLSLRPFVRPGFIARAAKEIVALEYDSAALVARRSGRANPARTFAVRRFLAAPSPQTARIALVYSAESFFGVEFMNRLRNRKRAIFEGETAKRDQ